MRTAIPNPCIGPIDSSVFNTSKSSVPCSTSDFGDGIHSFRTSTGVYHKPVDVQQKLLFRRVARIVMIDPEAVRKVIIIGISNYRDTEGAPGSLFEPGSWVAVSSLRL